MSTNATSIRKSYPSDISAEQFEIIRPLLESARARTKPREVDLHHIFNASLYILREGCRWRALPHDFPGWNTVYYHFRFWRDHIDPKTGEPLLELVLKKIGRRGTAQKREAGGDHYAHH